jgi:polyisoprenoid-binding protein YceI
MAAPFVGDAGFDRRSPRNSSPAGVSASLLPPRTVTAGQWRYDRGTMAAPSGRRLGPESGSILVRTYREGVAAKAGHDLVIEVTRWEATFDRETIELEADARSLEVRQGLRGVKPLTDKDRAEIRKNIDEKILHGEPIRFRSSGVDRSSGRLTVHGDLTMAGNTRPVTAELVAEPDGRITGTIPVTQSAWGIKPYRGLMGALKVRDEVEVEIDVRLPGER